MWTYIPHLSPEHSSPPSNAILRRQTTIVRLERSATLRGKFVSARSWALASKRKPWLTRFIDRIPETQTAESAVAAWIGQQRRESPHGVAPIVPFIEPLVASCAWSIKSDTGHAQESYAEFVDRLKRNSRERMKSMTTKGAHKAGSFWGTPRVGGGYMGNVRRPIKSRLEQQVAHWDVSRQEELPPERRRPREENRYLNHHFVEWLMGWPRGWANVDRSVSLDGSIGPKRPLRGSVKFTTLTLPGKWGFQVRRSVRNAAGSASRGSERRRRIGPPTKSNCCECWILTLDWRSRSSVRSPHHPLLRLATLMPQSS